MFYEVSNKVTVVDKKGNDRQVVEKILVKDISLFSEAELKAIEWYNNENEVVAIKQLPKLMEFVNERTHLEEAIYIATIESLFIDDEDKEKTTRYHVGIYALSLEQATELATEYMKGGMDDLSLVGIKKTKIIETIN
jgi:hypothetical protein